MTAIGRNPETIMELKEYYDYLIIGADAAGNSAVGQIRRKDKTSSIGMLEMGQVIAYGACGLPYAISGKIEQFSSLVHFTANAFGARNNADVCIGHEALEVDTVNKKVKVRDIAGGKIVQTSYNKLMIATGASPIRLPFIDYSAKNIFELKTVPDGERIQKYVKSSAAKKAAIIGAGYIGLEMAETLKEMGLEVVINEALPTPMPRYPESARKSILQNLKKNGVQILLDTKVTKVDNGEKVVVHTENGSDEFDLLLTAVGIKPATGFLKNSGVELDSHGAIIVDRHGKTNVKDVFAGGDCAVVYHHLLEKNVFFPLGHTANKQGRITGMNMVSDDIPFPGIVGSQIFKLFDEVYAMTGLSMEEAKNHGFSVKEVSAQRTSRAGYCPAAEKIKMSLLLEENSGQILGATYSGTIDSYGMIDAAAALIYARAKASDIAWMDFVYAPPVAPVWNALISAAGKFNFAED